jgi:hypothetical protein
VSLGFHPDFKSIWRAFVMVNPEIGVSEEASLGTMSKRTRIKARKRIAYLTLTKL